MWHTAKVDSQRSKTALFQMIVLESTASRAANGATTAHLIALQHPNHWQPTEHDQKWQLAMALATQSSAITTDVEDVVWHEGFAIVQVVVTELKVDNVGASMGYRQSASTATRTPVGCLLRRLRRCGVPFIPYRQRTLLFYLARMKWASIVFSTARGGCSISASISSSGKRNRNKGKSTAISGPATCQRRPNLSLPLADLERIERHNSQPGKRSVTRQKVVRTRLVNL